MTSIAAEACGADVPGILKRGGPVKVFAVFHGGWYLQTDEDMLLLCGADAPDVPFGIRTECGFSAVPFDKKFEGQAAFMRGTVLTFPSAELEIDLEQALYRAEMQSFPTAGVEAYPHLTEALESAKAELAEKGTGFLRCLVTGQTPEDRLYEACAQSAEAVIRYSTEGGSGPLEDALRGAIGLGRGLTPSMDDLLAGYMAAAHRLDPGHRVISSAIFEKALMLAPERTNRISGAFIKAAACGSLFGSIEDILNGKPDSAEKLMLAGASSGSDMLTGVLLAASVIKDKATCHS